MYSTCIYCKRDLGTNAVLESFPIGRRLAFDPARGRLWVVCRRCERWNLSPLEERWEACEDCERLFRDTRLRASTDNIGLAKLAEGLEIVPQIPNLVLNLPVRARVRLRDGRVLKFKRPDLQKSRFLMEPGSRHWVLSVKHKKGKETLEGEEARRVATQILPAINYMSGSKDTVRTAVERIEAAGDPERYLARLSREIAPSDPPRGYGRPLFPGKPGMVHKLPAPTRLALEMALHEEQEMRALMGELLDLEMAWREAEEIAGISDDMFVPPEVEASLARLRQEAGREALGNGEGPDPLSE